MRTHSIYVALLALCVAVQSGATRAQDASVAVALEPIPMAPYKSWSLFLVCNNSWARPEAAPQLRALYNQFLSFGDAIGSSHVAVWLAASRAAPTRIDSARSERFCENLKLPRSEGPYVVLTSKYPGAALTDNPASFSTDLGNHLVLSLNRLRAAETTRLLDTLAKQLTQADLESQDIQSAQFWNVLRKTFESPDDPLLGKVSATFQTVFFSTAIAQPAGPLNYSPPGTGPEPPPAIPSGTTWNARKSDGSPLRLTAFVRAGNGLSFDPSRKSYAGVFSVTLQNLDDREDRTTLPDPITVSIQATGASGYKPDPVNVIQLLRWMNVEITVQDPREPKFAVSVSADGRDPGNFVLLDVIRPRISLHAVSPNILGWGLGTTQITVTSPVYADRSLHLMADGGGSLDAGTVKLDGEGNGTAVLRSDASPSATVRADPMQGEAEPVTITFRPPYLFLLAAILGGLLGAFLRGKGRKSWGKALAIGVASAVLMTVGQAVGFTSWITAKLGANPIATSGEAVVFFLGAIAALIGVSALVPGTVQEDEPPADPKQKDRAANPEPAHP